LRLFVELGVFFNCGDFLLGEGVKKMSVKDKEIMVQKPLALRPFYEFPRLMDWFDELAPMGFPFRNGMTHPIKIEEVMKDDELIIRAELPGIDPEKDIEVLIEEGMLTISGERKESHKEADRSEFHYGSFMRTLMLPKGADESSVHADYKDGILEVKVKIPATTARSKRVAINRGK
jgi:HSP20 family protein